MFWKRKHTGRQDGPAARWIDLLRTIGESSTDLMLVTGPEDGGSVCTEWVGAVLSMSGVDLRFPSLVDAVEDGLFHPGCRHRLMPYRPEEGEKEAIFCTKLAVAGMARRIEDRSRALASPADAGGEGHRAEFMRWYDLARETQKANPPEIALLYCQEALGVLGRHNVFGDDQLMIERVLKGRMQTILRAQQRPEAKAGPVA